MQQWLLSTLQHSNVNPFTAISALETQDNNLFNPTVHCVDTYSMTSQYDLLKIWFYMYWAHLRRIKTEEKAKVDAAVWGTELIQVLAALAILHQDYLRKGKNSYYSSYHPGAIHPILYIVLVQKNLHGKELN